MARSPPRRASCPTDPIRLPTALIAEEELVGELRVGPTRSGRPLTQRDEELVRLSAVYLAAALRTGQREDRQAEALTDLSEDRAQLDSTASTLHVALLQRAAAPPGLHVFALGTLRVERGDERIQRWGGEKAGSRQAQALFAFLFDRGERGVAKDEALELIWPDTDFERADLAFHRTLGGLRHTLDPNGRGGRQLIRFYNDRYRLDPGVIDWSDVSTFLARLDQARATSDRGGGAAAARGGTRALPRRLPRRLSVLRRQRPRRGPPTGAAGPLRGPAADARRGLRRHRRSGVGGRRLP